MADKKNESVKDEQSLQAPPVQAADDYAGDKQYKDNPDKPAPESIAQVEVLPEDK